MRKMIQGCLLLIFFTNNAMVPKKSMQSKKHASDEEFVMIDQTEKEWTEGILKTPAARMLSGCLGHAKANTEIASMIKSLQEQGDQKPIIGRINAQFDSYSREEKILYSAQLILQVLECGVLVDDGVCKSLSEKAESRIKMALEDLAQYTKRRAKVLQFYAAVSALCKAASNDQTPAINYAVYGDPSFLAERIHEIWQLECPQKRTGQQELINFESQDFTSQGAFGDA